MNESTFGTPAYLREFGDLYQESPRQAALEWFRGARFGLFLHYGLYSIGGRHEWMQLRDCVPVREYAKLVKRFDAEVPNKFLSEMLEYIGSSEEKFWELINAGRSEHLWKFEDSEWRLRRAVWM